MTSLAQIKSESMPCSFSSAAGEPISLPEGEFTDTVEMLESSAIEPGTSEKIYVRGVGMVFDSGLELVSITRPNDAAE